MTIYTLAQAKARLSKVIEEVEAGQPVLITKHGQPAAVLTRADQASPPSPRKLMGCLKQEFAGWKMPDDFDRMMEGEITALFEGDGL
jgi:prevent-host-death family protein